MARIGDTVDPSLGRADTKGILLGAMEGAAAIGQGLAAAGQDLAAGMKEGRERKVKRKGAEIKIDALMKLHEGNEAMTSKLSPLLNILRSDEVTGRQKDAVVEQVDPIVSAMTTKQAQDVATAERNLANTYRAAAFDLQERQTVVQEKQARTGRLQAKAQLAAAKGKADAQLGFGVQEFNKKLVPDLATFLSTGAASAKNQIGDLDEVMADLESGAAKTGFWQGLPPDAIAQKRKSVEDKVKRIIFTSLKDILGAQFTENEAKELLKASYDTSSDEKYNLERVQALKRTLQDKYNNQMAYANQLQKLQQVFPDYRRGMSQEETQRGFLGEGFAQPRATPGAGPSGTRAGAGGTSEGRALAGMGAEEAGIERPLPPGADDFSGMLRQARFSEADLVGFVEGNAAQKVNKLNELRQRAGVGQGVGDNLSAEDKFRVMREVIQTDAEARFSPPGQPVPERAGPGDSPESPVPDVKLEGTVPGPPPSRLQQGRIQRVLDAQERALQDAGRAVPVEEEPPPRAEIDVSGAGMAAPATQAVPVPPPRAEIDVSGAGMAAPATQAVPVPPARAEIDVSGAGVAARAVALQDTIQTAALPRYSAALAEDLNYDRSATMRVAPRFAPSATERAKLRKDGAILVNLDSNHSGFKSGTKTPKRRIIEPMMVIPDDAKEETKTAAALAIGLMDNLYEKVHGKPPSKPLESRLLTKSQNQGRGRQGVVHTELFSVTDNKMINYLKTEAGIKEYAAVIREAFQDVPNLQIFLPHSEKAQGAETDKGSSEVSLALRALKYL